MRINFEDVAADSSMLPHIYEINDEAFPSEERIPSDVLLSIVESYGCRLMAIVDHDLPDHTDPLIGFVVIVTREELKSAYLWYFAIDARYRNSGYGTAALGALQQILSEYQIVLDMEQVLPEAENYEQRVRRLHFYRRNGFHRPMVGITYFGLHFELMYNNPPARIDDFMTLLRSFPNPDFRPQLYPLVAEENPE